MKYTSLAISNSDDLIFGETPSPLITKSGMIIGGGTVYPELNFTLPAMTIDDSSFNEVLKNYKMITEGALKRAAELYAPGVQLEFETLPPMVQNPEWSETIVKLILENMEEAKSKWGLKSVLRFTPNDNREMVRPPQMRSGKELDSMLETIDKVCELGADMISIESTGGKEIHDEALTFCNIRQSIFALCIMGCRDMKFLWDNIVNITNKYSTFPAGDSACGFGNTAMVLAEQKLIPRVFAAVIRPITAVRALVAHECGAVGPGKDCAYENPILKAVTGFPMAMEGKTAACAHFSPVGNIAAATCDLWSNESVQNIKLLGGMAPTCYMEQLIYDCRLMNQARAGGKEDALKLRNWMVDSDSALDPQAFVLTPENSITFGEVIVKSKSHYLAGREVGRTAVALLRDAICQEKVKIADNEASYLDALESDLDEMPDDEEKFIAEVMAELDTSKFTAADYGLV